MKKLFAILSCCIVMYVSAIPCDPNIVNPIPGLPFLIEGISPIDLTFSPDGKLLATSNLRSHDVSVFQIASNGTLILVTSSPFSVGGGLFPFDVAFSTD